MSRLRAVTTPVVHRVASRRRLHLPLCLAPPDCDVTYVACTYVERYESFRVVEFVQASVDCMTCLVLETRRIRQGDHDEDGNEVRHREV